MPTCVYSVKSLHITFTTTKENLFRLHFPRQTKWARGCQKHRCKRPYLEFFCQFSGESPIRNNHGKTASFQECPECSLAQRNLTKTILVHVKIKLYPVLFFSFLSPTNGEMKVGQKNISNGSGIWGNKSEGKKKKESDVCTKSFGTTIRLYSFKWKPFYEKALDGVSISLFPFPPHPCISNILDTPVSPTYNTQPDKGGKSSSSLR